MILIIVSEYTGVHVHDCVCTYSTRVNNYRIGLTSEALIFVAPTYLVWSAGKDSDWLPGGTLFLDLLIGRL